jgi:N6-L-threonylcarbamoyladenine synthase
VENRISYHVKLINMVRGILPVRHATLEVGQFDMQKINNPDIEGTGYQQGEQMGFWNTREYVLARDGHTCQHCKGRSGDKILNTHHIESRKVGGNAPNNLITLCKTCHEAYHRGELILKIKRGKSLRDAALMNVMKDTLYRRCAALYGNGSVSRTWGYLTKYVRIGCGLPKEHNVDARVISGNPTAKPCRDVWCIRQVRRHNRQTHRSNRIKGGVLRRSQAPYTVFGFRLNDIVRYRGVLYFVGGRRSSGCFSLRPLYGGKNMELSYRRLRLVSVCNRKIMYKLKKVNRAIHPLS